MKVLKDALPCDLFLNGFSVGFRKQVQQNTAEVVRVAVWIAQLVCNCIQEKVSPWKRQTIRSPKEPSRLLISLLPSFFYINNHLRLLIGVKDIVDVKQ